MYCYLFQTGTLTTNQMSVSKMFIAESASGDNINFNEFTITGSTYEPSGKVFHNEKEVSIRYHRWLFFTLASS